MNAMKMDAKRSICSVKMIIIIVALVFTLIFSSWDMIRASKNDILAYYAPVDSSRIHIERCIGLPGDVVSVEEGRAVINGKEREEDKTLSLHYMAYFLTSSLFCAII